jgi:hypothetical protein
MPAPALEAKYQKMVPEEDSKTAPYGVENCHFLRKLNDDTLIDTLGHFAEKVRVLEGDADMIGAQLLECGVGIGRLVRGIGIEQHRRRAGNLCVASS